MSVACPSPIPDEHPMPSLAHKFPLALLCIGFFAIHCLIGGGRPVFFSIHQFSHRKNLALGFGQLYFPHPLRCKACVKNPVLTLSPYWKNQFMPVLPWGYSPPDERLFPFVNLNENNNDLLLKS